MVSSFFFGMTPTIWSTTSPFLNISKVGMAWTLYFLATLGLYLALQVLPLIAPVVLWLGLKREAWAMLRGDTVRIQR